MKQRTTVKVLRQCFRRVLPAEDGRTALSPLNFVTGIIFCFLGDTKSFSLESMRRFLISQFEVKLSKGAFWERLSGRRLNRQLRQVLAELIHRVGFQAGAGLELLQKLRVSHIYLIDSSSVSLWHGCASTYPGAWTTAAIKWHAGYDLLSGQPWWFELSPGSTQDQQCFPELSELAGKLLIFDLGYWSYALLLNLDEAKGFFLSRVKSNATIRIESVYQGLSRRWIGQPLSAFRPKRKQKTILRLRGRIRHGNRSKVFRVIGFWNPQQKKYHWYVTNLSVSASAIYVLYRLRWTLELVFKSNKRSLNLDQRLRSNNEQIIESLVLASIIANFASSAVLQFGANALEKKQALSLSFQRAAHAVVQMASDFIQYITRTGKTVEQRLIRKIHLFIPELFEKNYRHRPPSLLQVATLLKA